MTDVESEEKMKQIFNGPKTIRASRGKIIRFGIFQGEHHFLLALIIGGIITGYAIFFSELVENKLPLFLTETPTALLLFVIIEELAKVLGICYLLFIKKNVSGLSIVLIPTVYEILETIAQYLFMGSAWGIIYPFHIVSGFIYLRFLQISKRMLFVAFVVNSLLHWIWNSQSSITNSMSGLGVTCVFFSWVILAILVIKPMFNKK